MCGSERNTIAAECDDLRRGYRNKVTQSVRSEHSLTSFKCLKALFILSNSWHGDCYILDMKSWLHDRLTELAEWVRLVASKLRK